MDRAKDNDWNLLFHTEGNNKTYCKEKDERGIIRTVTSYSKVCFGGRAPSTSPTTVINSYEGIAVDYKVICGSHIMQSTLKFFIRTCFNPVSMIYDTVMSQLKRGVNNHP